MAEISTTSSSSNSVNEATRKEYGGTNPEKKQHLEKLDSKLVAVAPEDPYAHLTEEEKIIIKRQVDIPEVKTSYFGLFRYASKADIALVVLAQISAIIGGAILPLMTVVFGQLTGVFKEWALKQITPEQLRHEVSRYTL